MGKYEGCDRCNSFPCGKTKLAKKYCRLRLALSRQKLCFGMCDLCVWKGNDGCAEWNGYERELLS